MAPCGNGLGGFSDESKVAGQFDESDDIMNVNFTPFSKESVSYFYNFIQILSKQ